MDFNFDFNSILLLVVGAFVFPMLKKWFPNLTLPSLPGPTPPAPDQPGPAPAPSWINQLINGIIAALLQKFLPAVQEVVRSELANRPPVQPADQPKIEQLPDGSFKFIPAKK